MVTWRSPSWREKERLAAWLCLIKTAKISHGTTAAMLLSLTTSTLTGRWTKHCLAGVCRKGQCLLLWWTPAAIVSWSGHRLYNCVPGDHCWCVEEGVLKEERKVALILIPCSHTVKDHQFKFYGEHRHKVFQTGSSKSKSNFWRHVYIAATMR